MVILNAPLDRASAGPPALTPSGPAVPSPPSPCLGLPPKPALSDDRPHFPDRRPPACPAEETVWEVPSGAHSPSGGPPVTARLTWRRGAPCRLHDGLTESPSSILEYVDHTILQVTHCSAVSCLVLVGSTRLVLLDAPCSPLQQNCLFPGVDSPHILQRASGSHPPLAPLVGHRPTS